MKIKYSPLAQYFEGADIMRKNKIAGKKTVLLLIIITCFSAGSAMAQMRFGLRAGASVDLTFRPNLEVGLGNNVTAVTANLELAYGIPIPEKQFSFYIGAGPALNVYRFNNSIQQNRDTYVRGGFNILFGLEHDNGLFGEMKVGTIDSPEVKFTVGYTFQ
jgi:hypothetical protein